jgi:transposase
MDKSVKNDRIWVMAKRDFQLTRDQSAELWRAYDQADDVNEQKRWQAVRLYGEGRSVSDIQAITGCSEPSLMRWTRRYRQQGIDGLRSPEYGGNRARLTDEQRAEIKTKVHQATPDQLLAAAERRHRIPFWTVEDLVVLVERWYGVRWKSRTSYTTLLHECGLSVQRVNKQYRSRPSASAIADNQAELEKK